MLILPPPPATLLPIPTRPRLRPRQFPRPSVSSARATATMSQPGHAPRSLETFQSAEWEVPRSWQSAVSVAIELQEVPSNDPLSKLTWAVMSVERKPFKECWQHVNMFICLWRQALFRRATKGAQRAKHYHAERVVRGAIESSQREDSTAVLNFTLKNQMSGQGHVKLNDDSWLFSHNRLSWPD